VPGGLQAVDPRAVLVQDLTGDGHADILVGDHGATRRGGHLTLLVWERGQFVPRPGLLPRSARELAPTTDLATAEVNADGLLDVFVDNGPGHASELLLSRHNSAGGLERFVSGASWLAVRSLRCLWTARAPDRDDSRRPLWEQAGVGAGLGRCRLRRLCQFVERAEQPADHAALRDRHVGQVAIHELRHLLHGSGRWTRFVGEPSLPQRLANLTASG
jgi:hypothetical protein